MPRTIWLTLSTTDTDAHINLDTHTLVGGQPLPSRARYCLISSALEGTGSASEVKLLMNGVIMAGVQNQTVPAQYVLAGQGLQVPLGPCGTTFSLQQTGTGTARATIGVVMTQAPY